MAFDVLGAVITGVLLYQLLRKRSDVGWLALTCVLFGFFVAGTGVHGAIHNGLHSFVIGVIDYIKNHVH
jgi:hypothetical protein